MLNMLNDESGVALPEYAMVLSVFSVVAFLALVAFSTVASNSVRTHIVAMANYNQDPTSYEASRNP